MTWEKDSANGGGKRGVNGNGNGHDGSLSDIDALAGLGEIHRDLEDDFDGDDTRLVRARSEIDVDVVIARLARLPLGIRQ